MKKAGLFFVITSVAALALSPPGASVHAEFTNQINIYPPTKEELRRLKQEQRQREKLCRDIKRQASDLNSLTSSPGVQEYELTSAASHLAEGTGGCTKNLPLAIALMKT